MSKRQLAAAAILSALVTLGMVGCGTLGGPGVPGTAALAASDADYQRLGIVKDKVDVWEDGYRTLGKAGTYEWWYFDANLKDGSTLVITFETKEPVKPDRPLAPIVAFKLDRPDGTFVHKEYRGTVQGFTSSSEGANIHIGNNSFEGNLKTYNIHIDIDNVVADVRLDSTTTPWRPATGFSLFKATSQSYFAWLPSVPQGSVSGTISVAGTPTPISGVGYHDHNWGDTSMLTLIHDWYWGRARVGDYTLIASYITATEKYGSAPIPIFLLCKGNQILAEDGGHVTFTAQDVHTDSKTGKPVANKVIYDYNDSKAHYKVTFLRKKDLVSDRFVDGMPGLEGLLARLVNFDGAYQRFTGTVVLDRFEGPNVVESISQDAAVWELMYFGHAPKARESR